MPIYVVRWPDFSVSVVRADDEEALEDMLDEVANPDSCRWEIYEGPLWFDLDLPVQIREPDEQRVSTPNAKVQFRGIKALLQSESLPYKVSVGGGDTGYEMLDTITAWAFPGLHKLFFESLETPSRTVLIKALRRDVVDMLKYAWRHAHTQKRTDFEGALLQTLGLTRAPPWLRRVIERQAAKRME